MSVFYYITVLLCIRFGYKQYILGLTQEMVFFIQTCPLGDGVHDRLHIYPPLIFYFYWHKNMDRRDAGVSASPPKDTGKAGETKLPKF